MSHQTPPQQPDDARGDPAQAPRYGMRLPEGSRIEDFIIPARPRRGAERRRANGSTAGDRREFDDGRGYDDARGHRGAPYPGPIYPGPDYPGPDSSAHGRPGSGSSGPGQPWQGHPAPYADGRRPGPYAASVWQESPEDRHRRTRRSRAVVLAVVGGLLMVIAPVLGLVMAALTTLEGSSGDLFGSRQMINGQSIHLPADTETAISSPGGAALEQCAVTDPSGNRIEAVAVMQDVTREGTMAMPGARLRTTEAGDYTIACEDVPGDARLLVGDPVVLRNSGAAGAWGLGGMVLGAVGFGLLVTAVVTLVRTRRPRW